jgi:hypothetical protein
MQVKPVEIKTIVAECTRELELPSESETIEQKKRNKWILPKLHNLFPKYLKKPSVK